MKRKRIKKYVEGGSTAFQAGSGFSGTGVGSGIGAFGGMAGGLIEGADMKDGYMSTGGALGSGALKGASMGAAFGPAGMLIGGALGAAGGLMKKQQVNDAEDARLKAERDEERLRANMENQMKHQQMNQVLDQFPVKGNNTPRFAMGGDTDPVPVNGRAKTPEELMAMQANANRHGTIKQYNPSRWELFKEAMHNHNMQDDSTFENAAEIVDFTGVSSWDDAYRAGVNRKERGGAHNADEMLDIVGAMPIFGKYKAGVGLGKSASKKLAHGFKESGEAALKHAKSASNKLNVVDGLEDEVGFMDSFAMGGPTGGGFDTSHMMVPRYAEGSDANAMPSFDFYADGQQVSAQDYIAAMPQGQNINDHSQYWMQQFQPSFDNATGSWSNAGQGQMATSAYKMLREKGQAETPGFAMGGKTGGNPYALTRAMALHPSALNYVDQYPAVADALAGMSKEEFSQFRDKTDALKRGAKELKGKGLGAALSFVKNADLSYVKPLREQAGLGRGEMIDEILGKTDLGWAGRKAAKAAVMMKDFALGGTTMGPGYEVEGGEMMQTKGETPMTYGQGGVSQVASKEFEVQGPKHSNGGVKANDNQGARVYSDKLTVDNALLSKLSKL